MNSLFRPWAGIFFSLVPDSNPYFLHFTDFSSRPRLPHRRPSWEYDQFPPQAIAGTYIDRTKLEQLLNNKFGRDYKLQIRSNQYNVYAAGKLTDAEIISCCV